MKTVCFPLCRPFLPRRAAVHAALGLLALLAAVPAAAQPAMSRGEQELPVAFDECMRRAEAGLMAEGYVNLWRTGSSVAGYRDVHSAIVMCNGAPSGGTWVNIVAASLSNDGNVPGAERVRLQGRMSQAVSPPATPCSGGGMFSLAVSPSAAVSGTAIQVSFTAPSGRPARDWVGLFPAGATGHVGQWFYTDGRTSGTKQFYAPSYPGAYEFRYLLNDGYDEITARCGFTVSG